jgi:hypothetical protein
MPRRLQTMPGVGPIGALAIETFAPPMEQFQCGRAFAAWLGLAPGRITRLVAGADVGTQATDGRRCRAGQQDGARHLADADTQRELSRSGYRKRRVNRQHKVETGKQSCEEGMNCMGK